MENESENQHQQEGEQHTPLSTPPRKVSFHNDNDVEEDHQEQKQQNRGKEEDEGEEEAGQNTDSKKKKQPVRQTVSVKRTVQQDASSDEDDDHHGADVGSDAEHEENNNNNNNNNNNDVLQNENLPKTSPVLVPSPPKTKKPTSDNAPTTTSNPSAKTNTSASSPLTSNKNNTLPPVNTKKGSPNNNNKKNGELGSRKHSIAFQQKVASHNFRDDDKSKPDFKVDRRPHELDSDKPKEPKPFDRKNPESGRRQSVAVQVLAKNHHFRDDDKSKPDFKVDRRPHELDSDKPKEPKPFDKKNPESGRRQSIPVQVLAKNHHFRDDDKSKPDFKVDRHPHELDSDKPKEPKPFDKKNPESGRRQSIPIQVLAKNHHFRDEDKTLPPFNTRNTVSSESTTARNNNNNHAEESHSTEVENGRDKIKKYQKEQLTKAQEEESKKQAKGKVAPALPDPDEKDQKKEPLKRKQSTFSSSSNPLVSLEKEDHHHMLKKKMSVVHAFGASASAAILFGGADSVRASANGGIGGGGAGGGAGDGFDPSFPRQPRCNPDSLEVPVSRITDLLWDKQVDAMSDLFPVAKIPWIYTKIWPGHAIDDEWIEMATDALVADRSSTGPKPNESTTSDVAAVPAAGQAPPLELPESVLTHKEFNLCHRIVAHLNNWFKQKIISEETTPKLLDLEAYAVVADRLKIEKPGKLFMELTDMRGDALPLGKLAKYFAAQKSKSMRAIPTSLLAATTSFRMRKQTEQEAEEQQQAMEDAASPKGLPQFPRQPKCDADDLTLPTSRILTLMFDRYASTPSFVQKQKQSSNALESASNNNNNNIENHLMDDIEGANSNNNNNANENSSPTTGGGKVIKIFPNSKFFGAMGKIWPGHTVPRDLVDDAIDVIVIDYRDERRKKFDDKTKQQEKDDFEREEMEFEQNNNTNNNAEDANALGAKTGANALTEKKKSFVEPAPVLPEDFSKDGITKDEFTLVFRIIANLSNWRTILPVGAPKLLGLEEFALAADRLKLDKIAKMFMEFTDNGKRDGVSQAQLALYFSLKKKTFRKDSNITTTNNGKEVAGGASANKDGKGNNNNSKDEEEIPEGDI